MPTISEIEAERARILQEIEQRAQQKTGEQTPASLKDWLNAAQEVMPQNAQIAQKMASYEQPTSAKIDFDEFDDGVQTSFSKAMQELQLDSEPPTVDTTASNRPTPPQSGQNSVKNPTNNSQGFSIAGFLLQISILAIFSIILYFGYRDLTLELKDIRETSNQEIAKLTEVMTNNTLNEETLKQIQESQERVTLLESKLEQLQSQLEELYSRPQQQIDFSNFDDLSTEQKDSIQKTFALNSGITEEMLDEKLRLYNDKLANQFEARLDRKLQPILNKLNLAAQKTPVTVAQPEEEIATIAEPQTPDTPELTQPLSEKPLLKMVEPVKEAKDALQLEKPVEVSQIKPIEIPEVKSQPKIAEIKGIHQEDVQWIQSQPKEFFTLQLASMKSVSDLERLVKSKGLENTKILPQVRNGKVNYILIVEALENRTQAVKLSEQLKKTTGISPWIRKLTDIQQKLNN